MLPVELEDVPGEIWNRLAARDGAWRTPVLASVASATGGDARMVVLRAVDTAERQLVFFTDRRSRKMAQLKAHPSVCMLVFDSGLRLQVRCYGMASEIRDAGRLENWWAGLEDFQRGHYAADVSASAGLYDKGRENFAAFAIAVERFHCLWLRDDGNQAADFEWRDGSWSGHPSRP